MANIKINETIVSNVGITDSGDLLGLNFMTNMTLAELEALFTPATSPEFRVVEINDIGGVETETVTAVYKNRKLITLSVRAGDEYNTVDLALQVTPAEIEEVEVLTNKVNEQAAQIEVQTAANDEQAAQIAEQAGVIEAQAAEIETLKGSLTETQAALGATQEELALAQETNNMLMECVLEMSEVVYA